MKHGDHQVQPPVRAAVSGRHVTSLVEMARDGDRTAFEQLVDLFQEEIFRVVYYRTWSRVDTEDLTQEIFIRAYRNFQVCYVEENIGWNGTVCVAVFSHDFWGGKGCHCFRSASR